MGVCLVQCSRERPVYCTVPRMNSWIDWIRHDTWGPFIRISLYCNRYRVPILDLNNMAICSDPTIFTLDFNDTTLKRYRKLLKRGTREWVTRIDSGAKTQCSNACSCLKNPLIFHPSFVISSTLFWRTNHWKPNFSHHSHNFLNRKMRFSFLAALALAVPSTAEVFIKENFNDEVR